ncbi:MAG: VWA domain-containing protein [Ornithinimicrobium sp.]
MRSAVVAVVAAVLCLVAPSASAQEGDSGALLVIMDVSGSMNEDDGAGAPRINGARAAAQDLVEAVPDGTRIGLRVYGDRYDGSDKEEGCQDTRLAVPIGPVESTGEQINTEIDDSVPSGFTPIGLSLEQAADDFTDDANRSIVLVSDGEDTCGDPRPCDVAKDLSTSGIDVRVDTIGLAIEDNPQAQTELECIAEATGGDFVQAADASELTNRLSQLSTRAVQGWSADGEEIEGGAIVTQATPIEAGTTYVDDVVANEARWFSFPAQEGQDITVTVSEDGSQDYGCCVALRLYTPDQTSSLGLDNGAPQGTAQILRVTTPPDGAFESGDYYVSVDRSTSTRDPGPVTFQLDVSVEGGDAAAETSAPASTEPATDDAEASATPDSAGADEAEATVAADPPDTQEGNGLLITLVVILGVAVLALGGVVAWLVVRMNKPSS